MEGFDNVLAQARSLRVSVAILVQEIASLKKTSEIEAQRLLGNTGLKVALKVEEQKTAEEIVEMLGKSEEAMLKMESEQSAPDERRFDVTEKEKVRIEELKMLKPGHGYIMWAGQIQPMLVRYYEPPVSPEIPEFGLVKENIYPKYKIEESKREIIKNYQGTEEIKAVLTIEEKAEFINKEHNTDIFVVDRDNSEVKEMDVLKLEKKLENHKEIIETLAKKVEEDIKYNDSYKEIIEDFDRLDKVFEEEIEDFEDGEFNIKIEADEEEAFLSNLFESKDES